MSVRPNRDSAGLMKVVLALICLLPTWLGAQENSTSTIGGRLKIYGGASSLRVAMVQDADIIIRDLDQLVGELPGKAFPIFLKLYPAVEGKSSRIGQQFLKPEGGDSKYLLQIDLRLGRGNSFDRKKLDKVILEMLLIERSLRALPPEQSSDRVEIRPWLVDGIGEALLWRKNRGDRRMYLSLMESGGWMEVAKMVDQTKVDALDVLSRELFRASSGALVMALLSQNQGTQSLSEFLNRVATFEGEQMTLLRSHFPQANLGKKGLDRWWMLQVAALSEKKLTEAMTIPETDKKLVNILELYLKDAKGRAVRLGLDSWKQVADLESQEERSEAVRPTSDLLAHLSFRCFPTYRPAIGGYLAILSNLAEGKTEEIDTMLGNLQSFRTAEVERHHQLVDLLNWYHLSSVKEESGEFEDYLRVKGNLRRGSELRDDPLQDYMDQVEKIFKKPK